jgi:flavin-dependent thymidylate synthase
MKTKQEVKLLYISPLVLISNAIRYSHANWDKSDSNEDIIGDNDFNLIKRVGFKLKHHSILEHSMITYHLKLSQKALLEATRHRVGVSWTVTSSRYALKKINIELEPTGDENIDTTVYDVLEETIKFAFKYSKSLDVVSKLLPQSFLYIAQVTFNLRSLLHFFRLRLAKDAHRDIRIIAYLMYKELPDDYKKLIKEDEVIEKHLIRCKDEGFDKLVESY